MILNDTIGNKIAVPSHIKGLIFDMDGTLINSIPAHYKAWLEACSKYGISFSYDYFVKLTGRPVVELSKDIIAEYKLQADPLQLVHEKEMLVEKNLSQVQLIEPVIEVIRQYTGRLPMAVGTGASKKMATRLLTETGLYNSFECIVTSDDVQNYKPHPDTFLKAASHIGVSPAECLVFEDGDLGIKAALSGGMHVIDVKPFYE